ncbi:MAG TPA: TetR/AcrR family transcriptional regulator [Kofleriaceae bacterium]|jgi:AcrR family transcriptional regulator|nr:TetR/AcrR family transcriptional regulator [Kofleriaceae bacterium]
MPTPTFARLPAARRDRLVAQAIAEFAERSYTEASLSRIARRSGIAKGSFYQYFENKLDLYRYLLGDEAARRKRAFIGAIDVGGEFWTALERFIERGMAFLVAHPGLARLAAAAADPTALPEVRGLHLAICEAGIAELRTLLERGIRSGAIARGVDLDVAARLVSAVIGPGLTDAVLSELGASLHEVLASVALRGRLDARRRRRLAREAVNLLRNGLGAPPGAGRNRGLR